MVSGWPHLLQSRPACLPDLNALSSVQIVQFRTSKATFFVLKGRYGWSTISYAFSSITGDG